MNVLLGLVGFSVGLVLLTLVAWLVFLGLEKWG